MGERNLEQGYWLSQTFDWRLFSVEKKKVSWGDLDITVDRDWQQLKAHHVSLIIKPTKDLPTQWFWLQSTRCGICRLRHQSLKKSHVRVRQTCHTASFKKPASLAFLLKILVPGRNHQLLIHMCKFIMWNVWSDAASLLTPDTLRRLFQTPPSAATLSKMRLVHRLGWICEKY